MSIGSIMSMAQSALLAAQTQVQVASDNVANVDTPGYARKIVNQQELVSGGVSEGVTSASIQNVASQFLAQSNLTAMGQSKQAGVVSDGLDQAQALFGDPTSANAFFSGLDNVYTALSASADSPSSSLLRQSAVTAVSGFLSSAGDLNTSLDALQVQSNQQLASDITSVNGLLGQVSSLNAQITQGALTGGDATGAQDRQTQLLTQLAGMMSIRVLPNATGGVTVRSVDGAYLAGDQGGATLAYTQSGGAAILTATPPKGGAQTFKPGGGEIGGLVQMTQVELPAIKAQVGEYVRQAVTQLNAASNASTATPPPASLTGKATGMALDTAIGGFTGKTTVAMVDSAGVIQQRVDIDFSAGTIIVNGGAASSFTPATFLSSLNTALGVTGSASYANGALSISAASGGVAIGDDATTPSSKAGEGFSQFFGLNDLITSTGFTNFNTGLSGADPNTFGGSITLQLADPNGAGIRQQTTTIPAGGTIGGVIAALNASIGGYGSFSLDSNGQLSFAPNATSQATISVSADSTVNSAGGPSLSQMFGIGDNVRAARLGSYSVRTDIAQNATKLPYAQLNLSATAGAPALATGDGSGALAMAQSGQTRITFASAGGLASNSMSIASFAAQIAGLIGLKASNASTAQATADATAKQAAAQFSSVTGVSLDQELVNLTTYQQAYSASSRLIQAASTMYDTLLQMVK